MKAIVQPVKLSVEPFLQKVRADEVRVNELARLIDSDCTLPLSYFCFYFIGRGTSPGTMINNPTTSSKSHSLA